MLRIHFDRIVEPATGIIVLLVVSLTVFSIVFAQDTIVFLRDDFNSLENWKPLTFPKIKRHTNYAIVHEGEGGYLKAESDASASGIVLKDEFNVFEYPKIRWQWKISNVYEKGDARVKAGDDYPLRVYILFKYDPENAPLGKRMTYGLAKALYGEYPPDSSLSYIWANREHGERIINNTYAEEAKMIILQTGNLRVGSWIKEEVNILEDYQEAYGADPPHIAKLAIMNDSDDTGEHSVSYVDYIEIFR